MKNTSQYQSIIDNLGLKKNAILSEITRVSMNINKRQESLTRIKSYQNEYVGTDKLPITKSIPTLSRNLDSFTNKLQEIVLLEENEIAKLEYLRDTKLNELSKIEEKINLLNKLIDHINKKHQYKLSMLEQLMLDEFAVLKNMTKDIA